MMSSFSDELRIAGTGLNPSTGSGGLTGIPDETVELHPDRPWLSKTGTVTQQVVETPVDFSKIA